MTPKQRTLLMALLALLTLQTVTSSAVSTTEKELPSPSLERIPQRISDWRIVSEQALDPPLVAYLRPDDYILRDYVRGSDKSLTSVVVMYFKSLKTNYGPHAPRICLPGTGWIARSASMIALPVATGSIEVNRYLMERGGKTIVVLYWYQNSRRSWAQEFQTKLNLLPDLLRYQRSDLSLVRISASLGEQGTALDQDPRVKGVEEFARLLYPLLSERFGGNGPQ